MPYAELVELVRNAMTKVNADASTLDKTWADMKITTKAPPMALPKKEPSARVESVNPEKQYPLMGRVQDSGKFSLMTQHKLLLDKKSSPTHSKRDAFPITKILSSPKKETKLAREKLPPKLGVPRSGRIFKEKVCLLCYHPNLPN